MNSELYLHIKTIRSQLPLIYGLPVNMCLKDWIDAEEHNQYRDQPQSSGVETEESYTEPRPGYNSNSDGAEESEQ
jgi:hypothetical protein